MTCDRQEDCLLTSVFCKLSCNTYGGIRGVSFKITFLQNKPIVLQNKIKKYQISMHLNLVLVIMKAMTFAHLFYQYWKREAVLKSFRNTNVYMWRYIPYRVMEKKRLVFFQNISIYPQTDYPLRHYI